MANENEPVFMRHPGVQSIGGPIPRHAFRTVWQNRGWTEIGAAEVAASRALGRDVPDVAKLSVGDLETVVRTSGLDPAGAKSKSDLIALLGGTGSTGESVGSAGEGGQA